MPDARSLEDLLKIRDHNRSVFDGNPGVSGTALGSKNETGPPAVLAFVERKILTKWLKNVPVVPPRLSGPGNLECPTDVIEMSGTAFDRMLGTRLLAVSSSGEPSTVLSRELFGYRDLNRLEKHDLLAKLRGASETITPGSRLAFNDADGLEWSGTLACFVEAGGRLGILTNKHVGQNINTDLFFPEVNGTLVATVTDNIERVSIPARFPGLQLSSSGSYMVDGGIGIVPQGFPAADLDFRLPVLEADGTLKMKELGDPLPLDLGTMGPVGTEVIGVGQMRSHQKGKISAFAYEWTRGAEESIDYLIRGTERADDFSDPGDSGKLIVTADGALRPVALMWGGDFERLRHRYGLENWSYATDINFVLAELGARVRKR